MDVIELRAGGYRAEIIPRIGGNCIRLHHEQYNAELLRTPPDASWLERAPNIYGMPLLFPPGRIGNGRFTFEGRAYSFPLNEPGRGNHLNGILSCTPFEVCFKTRHSLSLRHVFAGERTGLIFPHLFTVWRSYELTEEGLTHRMSVRNDGQTNMPCGIGLHTAFRVPFEAGGRGDACRLRVPVGQRILLDPSTYLPTGETCETSETQAALRSGAYSPAEEPLSMLARAGGNTAVLSDASAGLRITYLTPDLPFYVLWNGGGREGFVCIEPVSWMSDAPNRRMPTEWSGFAFLRPDETRRWTQRLFVGDSASR